MCVLMTYGDHLPFLSLPATVIHPLMSSLERSDSALNQSIFPARSLCQGQAQADSPLRPAVLQSDAV